jgi:hypothetical protein
VRKKKRKKDKKEERKMRGTSQLASTNTTRLAGN